MSAQPELQPRFRPMREEDLDTVMHNETRAYTAPWTSGIFRDCLRVGYNCWVLEINGEIRGHGVMSVAVGETHLLNICIDPDLHGQGLGRMLVRHLLDLSVEYGARMALLEVRPSNVAAIALYETLGFSEVGQRRNYYPGPPAGSAQVSGAREDAIVMALGLPVPDELIETGLD